MRRKSLVGLFGAAYVRVSRSDLVPFVFAMIVSCFPPPARWLPLLVGLFMLGAAPAWAQMEITSVAVARDGTQVEIEDGAAGIELTDTLYFRVSRQLPFNSLFTRDFSWEPRNRAFRSYIFLDENRDNPRFTIVHQPQTDYAVYVFGLQAEDGAWMERPFTINYTTAAAHGDGDVSGTVRFASGPAAGLPSVEALRTFAARAVRAQRLVPAERTNVPVPAARVSGPAQDERPSLVDGSQVIARAVAGAESVDHTVVFLMDRFALEQGAWSVRAAAAVQAGGTYRFDHVRDGTYYPVAIHFADQTGETISAYGFYDADGDRAPDPVAVSGGVVDGIPVELYAYTATAADARRADAEARAAAWAADAALVEVEADDVAADGTDHEWIYTFYSATADSLLRVSINPITTTVEALDAEPADGDRRALPSSGLMPSAEIVQRAEQNGGADFRAQHSGRVVELSLRGGNLPGLYPPDEDAFFWIATYTASGTADRRTVYLDMQTGAVLDPASVAPRPITLLFPTDAADEQFDDLSLIWKEEFIADRYQVQLATAEDFSAGSLVRDEDAVQQTFVAVLDLDYSTTYYWRVRGINGVGAGAWSDVWRFTTSAPPPTDAAVLTAPAAEAIDVPLRPTLSWEAVAGATSYVVELSTQSDFVAGLVAAQQTTGTSYALEFDLTGDTEHFWRVRGLNAAGQAPWSEVRSFTTVAVAPGQVTALLPADGASDVDTPPTFSWSSDAQAARYHLQISAAADFAVLAYEADDLTGLTHTAEGLSNMTTYFWRVRATNSVGPGPWSAVLTFTTVAGVSTESTGDLPERFALHANYPNPFNPRTTLRFDLVEAGPATLTIFDALGRKVETLVSGVQAAGSYEVVWEARDRASGLYIARLQSGRHVEARRLVLMK